MLSAKIKIGKNNKINLKPKSPPCFLPYLKLQPSFLPVVQRFILPDNVKAELKKKKAQFGFNGLGEVVFRRTYSRNNEDWGDVVTRVVEGVFSIRKEHYYRNGLVWEDGKLESYAKDMALSLFDMNWMPPGRGLWMMGTDYVYNKGSTALNNCSATDTKDDFVLSAEWTMDCLMNGVGVGFTTNWRGEASMPNKKATLTYTIPDSREGWVESLILLLCSYIDSPKYGKNLYPTFDYSQIRKAGLKINGFGGLSSGPEPLKKLHSRVETYLDALSSKRLKTVAKSWVEDENGKFSEVDVQVDKPYSHTRFIADVFNAIGACVVAGNVRRSAEICLGDVSDSDFINLKNYTENPERGEIGWMSNNSVVLKSEQDYNDFSFIPDISTRIRDNGEPGIINLHNIQKYGRYGKILEDKASLVNPCGEIALENFELCNLSEIFPTRCKSIQEFYKAAEYATFYSSTVSLLPTHRPETNAVIAKNRRIGVSISGIAQWVSGNNDIWGVMNATRMTKFLRDAYKIVKNVNCNLAREAGIPASVRITTVKPSGSISLLAGVTPGVHYPVSRYAIRRMRIGKNSPLVEFLKLGNIPYEIDITSENTLVFEFVIDHGDVRPCNEVSPWEQFALVTTLQRCYSDNCVSATIYFDKDKDGPDVEKMIAMYIPTLKSVSMLPHSGHGYKQAPYEPITKEQYELMKDKYRIPDFNTVKNNIPAGSMFCSGDTCEL